MVRVEGSLPEINMFFNCLLKFDFGSILTTQKNASIFICIYALRAWFDYLHSTGHSHPLT